MAIVNVCRSVVLLLASSPNVPRQVLDAHTRCMDFWFVFSSNSVLLVLPFSHPPLAWLRATSSQAFVGTCGLGDKLANRSGISAMKGYLAPNRGVVVRERAICMEIGCFSVCCAAFCVQ